MTAASLAGTAAGPRARIGPNAITRVAEALEQTGEGRARAVFAAARLEHYLHAPPEAMVDQTEVVRLHRALRATLGGDDARYIVKSAGRLTGDYLLAHRIPRGVQAALRALPAPIAAPVLLAAIRRHAWTFAGSGRFSARAGRPARLTIAGNPLCEGAVSAEPLCDFYTATFQQLFRALVHPHATVAEVACEACGAEECRFEVRW
jgi:divinyl protochlorophyllide a 8-vinyl-reductase